MKLLKHILLWGALVAYLFVILSFVQENKKKVVCRKVDISINDESMNKFLRKEDVTKVLEKYRLKLIGQPIDSINTLLAEELINKNKAVRTTAAYTTIDGELEIKVEQRKPILRVTNEKLQNYYLDEAGQLIPILSKYAAYTLIANGHINEPFSVTSGRNIFPSNKDSILMPNVIYDLYYLAMYINNDSFWQSQIEQLYVNSKNEIELVPRVGQHRIIFGNAKDIDVKFKKLKAMYRAFNEIGWNQYKTINLKYQDQVVCTKR
jgi:cell division protein FtsQ